MYLMKLKNLVATLIHSRYAAAVILAVLIHANAYAQTGHVTIDADDRSVNWILSQVTEQTGYEAVFSDSFLDSSMKVTMSFSDAPLETVLDRICELWDASYKIVNKTIVFSRNGDESSSRGGAGYKRSYRYRN